VALSKDEWLSVSTEALLDIALIQHLVQNYEFVSSAKRLCLWSISKGTVLRGLSYSGHTSQMAATQGPQQTPLVDSLTSSI
jgi:hypothetical protein